MLIMLTNTSFYLNELEIMEKAGSILNKKLDHLNGHVLNMLPCF